MNEHKSTTHQTHRSLILSDLGYNFNGPGAFQGINTSQMKVVLQCISAQLFQHSTVLWRRIKC